MVEKNAVAGVHPVSFSVVDSNPISVHFGDRIGAARIERGRLALWNFADLTIEFAR